MKNKGIKVDLQTFDLVSAKFSDDLTLYADHDKNGPKKKGGRGKGQKTVADYEYLCFYTKEPSLISASTCADKVCQGTAKCWTGGNYMGEIGIVCKGAIDSCPSASACAADKTVSALKNAPSAKEDFETNLKKGVN